MAYAPRVFIDTNILISGLCFDGPPRRLLHMAEQGILALVLADYVLREAEAVIVKKMPERQADLDEFLSGLTYETVPSPSAKMVTRHKQYVTHEEDAPVLASAILADADYVVSGDKAFAGSSVREMVEILTCTELLLLLAKAAKRVYLSI